MSSLGRIDLVVSHNQEASDAAVRLVDWVEAQGHSAWADVKAFYSPLVSAEKQIARAFSRARVICLFVGDNYRDTRWCQEEYSLGLRAEQDMSINRVIAVYQGEAGRSRIPSLLLDRPTFPFTNAGHQGVIELLSTLPDHSAALAHWNEKGSAGRSDLLCRLPISERTKLVVDHAEFLVKHFGMGNFEQGSETHAFKLGLTGKSTSKAPVHLTPALLMEFTWRWALDILGKYSVLRLLDSPESAERQEIDVEAVTPFLRLPAVFQQYLIVARERRSPPVNTETELLAVVDHVLCGFGLLCARAGVVEIEDASRDVGKLLSLFVRSESKVSRAAAYLQDRLPEIAFPENAIQRQVTLYSLLRE